MDINLLVEIYVPTGPGAGLIATGYPIGKGIILTAGHAVCPDNRDENFPIEVRWYHKQGALREWRTVESILWYGGDDYDAALLKCPFSEETDWGVISDARPTSRDHWTSEGFARAGVRDDDRRPVGLSGETFPMADSAQAFELGVNYATDIEENWQGASGSPVFVGRKIIGVVATCPPNFNATRLRATPAWKLLQNTDFRSKLVYDARKEILERVRNEIVDALSSSVMTNDTLNEQFGLGNAAPTALVDALLSLRFDKLVELITRTHRAFCDNGKATDAKVLSDLLNVVLPVVFDDGIIEDVRSRRTDTRAVIVSLPAATATAAEIIMAGVDRRATKFQMPSSTEEYLPRGELNCGIQTPPEGGMDADINSCINIRTICL